MESHSEYMRRRAGEEQDAADRAANPKVRDRHSELADRYRDAADGPPRGRLAPERMTNAVPTTGSVAE